MLPTFRSQGEFQFGYFLTKRLSVQVSGVWIHTHNGIGLIYGLFPNNLSDEQWLNHDRITRTRQLDMGGAANYAINRSTTMFVGFGRSLYGYNAHLRAVVLTVGVTRSFTTRRGAENLSASVEPEPVKAFVCTCAKSK